MSSALGLPQDFLLPTPWNSCNDMFQEATTCQTSGGYDDYSSMKEYKFDSSGGQTSRGSDLFEDAELDAEFDHGYAYRVGVIENEYRDPATRHKSEDDVGIPWTRCEVSHTTRGSVACASTLEP